jgi:predicted ATP-grasp superfamily ATP-dependent carboligase
MAQKQMRNSCAACSGCYDLRVLVCNGDTRPALAITRSLGASGHHVIVSAERIPSLASTSRYCAERELCPPVAHDPAGFVETMLQLAARHRTQLLLPVTEIATVLLAEQRDRLPASCVLPLPSTESLRIANDKRQVLDLAKRIGVPIPRTILLASLDEAMRQSQPSFPVVIKPARSRALTQSGWQSASVDYADDQVELIEKLGRLSPHFFPVLLQERILGAGEGVFACYQEGRLVAMFSHRRLREKPPSGGVSVLCESISLDAHAADYADRLLRTLNWHGVAMVEFKRTHDDGSLRLMEINGRFWGSLQLAIDSGADFPVLLARIAAGETLDLVTNYRIGVRSRWFLGDLDSLMSLLCGNPRVLRVPARFSDRMRALARFLSPPPRNQLGEVLRWDDPRPAQFELGQWLRGR